jgi:hypothetical protein
MKKKHYRVRIKDEFTDLSVSRQRRYQLRRQKEGRCIVCGQPQVAGSFCLRHMIAKREVSRRRLGLTKRNYSLSYRLEEMAKVAQSARGRRGAKPPKR